VFLFIDGQGGRPPPGAWALFGVADGDTLYDYWSVHGRSPGGFGNLDPQRHRNRINVVFVDGHGETLTLPNYRGSIHTLGDKGGIASVGVNMGISN
jgi:prepilin-type processing-associated H-X9-DG protein